MKILLFGAPGSGKGTQAVVLCEKLGLKKISLGDILRQEVKKESELGLKVKGYMEKGVLVPDEVVSQVIEEHLGDFDFLLDGYPRNINQARRLDDIFKKKSIDIDFCIYLDADEETITSRLSKRRVCRKCSANYHLVNMPSKKEGICDFCEGELYQRKDDNPETIKKRWEVFLTESSEILDFYQVKGKLLKVDGSGNKDQVYARIKTKM